MGSRNETEIRGPEIAMNDPKRVCGGTRGARLDAKGDDIVDRQRSVLLEVPRPVLPSQELHDHVRGAALQLPHVQNAHDVIVSNLRRGPGLPPESTNRLVLLD